MWHCVLCGTENDDDLDRCVRCGQRHVPEYGYGSERGRTGTSPRPGSAANASGKTAHRISVRTSLAILIVCFLVSFAVTFAMTNILL